MKVLTQNGFKNFESIIDQGVSFEILEISFDDGSTIQCTYDHEFLVNENFVPSCFLEIGDVLCKKTITYIDYNIGCQKVYDLKEVEDTHSYVTNGVISHNCNLLYLDEFAFVEKAEEFYTSTYPVVSAGKTTKVIITSTANGIGNPFYNIWQGAVAGTNEFSPFRVDWWDVPGRDEAWKEQTIKNTSQHQFDQEFSNCLESNSQIQILLDGIVYNITIGNLYDAIQRQHSCGLSLEEEIRSVAIRYHDYQGETR